MNFSLSLSGLRQAVIQRIYTDTQLPAHVRTFLSAEIAGLPQAFNGARVDIHGTQLAGISNVHSTVTPLNVAA